MRAIVVREFGGRPEIAEMPTPEAGPGQVQIQLEAAGVNPIDQLIIDGFLDGQLPHDFPMIPGVDGAGTVAAVGSGVHDFEIGDRVVGKFLFPPIGHGTFAEYLVAPHDGTLVRLSDEITAIRAAALPTAGITALDLMHAAGVTRGQQVLVVGASGGVGSYLVQLAALAGAHVIATARPDDTDRMIRLGATEVVNYGRMTVTDSPTHAEGLGAVGRGFGADHRSGRDRCGVRSGQPAAGVRRQREPGEAGRLGLVDHRLGRRRRPGRARHHRRQPRIPRRRSRIARPAAAGRQW